MRKYKAVAVLLGLGLFISSGCPLFAQSSGKVPLKMRQASWQQKVDHTIRVTLDTQTFTLHADEMIVYTNNSPDTLSTLWFHIWPNAFSARNSGYGKEALYNGNIKYLNAPGENRGSLDSLSFRVNGKPAMFTYHPDFSDIVQVWLPEPILPGKSHIIQTPFRVKLPYLFSRMGHKGRLVAATQWYPKPAVYDVNGWNTMPYLEQGEYYSEFGDYDVQITLPGNMRVAATGMLQNTNELLWLDELAGVGTDDIGVADQPASKTLHYIQKQVPDFAWFAHPEFEVAKGSVQLDSTHTVTTWAFFIREKLRRPFQSDRSPYTQITANIAKALKGYSAKAGMYPYGQCTVVVGGLSSAGGMEYPMITICSDADATTTIHEVGHNWFQGMLGSQERRYPWMDESLNTFYEQKVSGEEPKQFLPGEPILPVSAYAGMRAMHDVGVYQPGNLAAGTYNQLNYGAMVYGINPLRLNYLQSYLGDELFRSCVQRYFSQWQYRHPLPGDIQDAFEAEAGQSLKWFFQDLMGGTLPDYALGSVRKSNAGYLVKVRNKGAIQVPVRLSYTAGKVRRDLWLNGRDTQVLISRDAEQVSLNSNGWLPEKNLANNDGRTHGIFRTWAKPHFGLPYFYTRGQNNLGVFPWPFAFNPYDGWMPGLLITNITFPRRNWEWWVTPFYGLKSKQIAGTAGIQRNLFHNAGRFQLSEISLRTSRFHFSPDAADPERNAFNHLALQWVSRFRRTKAESSSQLGVSLIINRMDRGSYTGPHYDSTGAVDGYLRYATAHPYLENDLLRVYYRRESMRKLAPGYLQADAEFGGLAGTLSTGAVVPGKFLKLNLHGETYFLYPNQSRKNIGLRLRGWFSALPFKQFQFGNAGGFGIPVTGANGYNDYGFTQIISGRTATFMTEGRYGYQMLNESNALRMPYPRLMSSNWVCGGTVQSHILPFLPLQFYVDAALWDPGSSSVMQFDYVGGITLRTHTGNVTHFEISLPLVYSKTLRTAIDTRNQIPGVKQIKWYHLLNFRVNWNLWNPWSLSRLIAQ
ncbi:MAG: M1 family metallopeptidase [Bacteroidetes bacterium]|nr:M1 family metallopeptidase [Bacteroidota bacterium]